MSVFGLTYNKQDKLYMSHIYDYFIYYYIKIIFLWPIILNNNNNNNMFRYYKINKLYNISYFGN